MFKKDLMIPALLGLGLYAQNSDISLSNNTTMLVSLFVLLDDHEKINELESKVCRLERAELCECCRQSGPKHSFHNGCCNSSFGKFF